MEKYDKVDWHLDGGEDYDEVIERFTSVIEFLKENDMLSEDGIKEFENGVDDSTILCDEQLTETGNEFIKKYLDLTEQLAEHLGDMKSALNMLFIRFKGEQI